MQPITLNDIHGLKKSLGRWYLVKPWGPFLLRTQPCQVFVSLELSHTKTTASACCSVRKNMLVPNLTFSCEMRHQTTTTVSYMVFTFSNENNVDAISLFFGTKYKNNKNGVMET